MVRGERGTGIRHDTERAPEREGQREKRDAGGACAPPTHSRQEQASTAVTVTVTSAGKDSKQHPSLSPQTKTSFTCSNNRRRRRYIRRYKVEKFLCTPAVVQARAWQPGFRPNGEDTKISKSNRASRVVRVDTA
ncbi:unnamed protein product, partial [Ectocarpus sp. 8 AP-2014]